MESRDPCDRFGAKNGNFNMIPSKAFLTQGYWTPSLLMAASNPTCHFIKLKTKRNCDVSSGDEGTGRAEPRCSRRRLCGPAPLCRAFVFQIGICVPTPAIEKRRLFLFSAQKNENKGVLMRRPNKTEPASPRLELNTPHSILIH